MAHSDAKASSKSFIVASKTQLAARMYRQDDGSFHACCPYCNEHLSLHDERWMIPAHSLVGQQEADEETSHAIRSLALSLVEERVPITLFSAEVHDPELISLKKLGYKALPSDFPDTGFAGLYQCDACERAFIAWHSSLTVELPVPFAKVTIKVVGSQIHVEIRGRSVPLVPNWKEPNSPWEPVCNEYVFDTKTGMVLKDGEPQLYSFAHSSCELSSVLGNYDVYNAVAHLFPKGQPFPRWMRECNNDFVLALATRFQGYPEAFYVSCCKHFKCHGSRLMMANVRDYNSWEGKQLMQSLCELPLHYEQVDELFGRTTLPNTKSIRRLAFENPLLIAAARCSMSLPFDDINLLRTFLSMPSAPGMFSELVREDAVSFWNDFVQTKGAKKTFEIIRKLEPFAIRECMNTPALYGQELLEWAKCCGFKLTYSQASELRDFAYVHKHGVELKQGYAYAEDQIGLARETSKYEFILPKQPLDLHKAGNALHNCLSKWDNRQDRESTVVLVNERGQEKPVAAIEVDLEFQKILQAKVANNQPIPSEGALRDAIDEWAKSCNLEWGQSQCERDEAEV